MADFTGRIGNIENIESPWGNAGGVVKTVEDVEKMAHTGVGWIEAGSYTLEMRRGNKWNPDTEEYDPVRTDYDHDSETGLTHNSLGMPNKGMDVVETEIPEMVRIAHAHSKKLLVNVAPVSQVPVEESVELVRRSYAAGADGVILNAGCPNVKDPNGQQHRLLSRSPEEFLRVLTGLISGRVQKRIMTRISPQETQQDMYEICNLLRNSGIITAVFLPNTWPVPMPGKEQGSPLLGVPMDSVGRSGPGMAEQAAIQTFWAGNALFETGVDIVSSSSIMDATELKHRMDLGAVAGAGTTFYYESKNGWQEDTDRLLSDLAA
jgi:dihydroorotate dehydrogenase